MKTPRDIRGGVKRRSICASQERVGRFFRNGVTRERIRQIESSKTLAPEIILDYRRALAEVTKLRETAARNLRTAAGDTCPDVV